ARTGKVRTSWPLPKEGGPGGGLPALTFDADGRRLALAWVAGGQPGKKAVEPELRVHVLDVESGQTWKSSRQAVFTGRPSGAGRDTGFLVLGLAYHGRLAASVVRLSLDDPNVSRSEVVIWDPETGQSVRSHALDHMVNALNFDHSGGLLAAAGG